MAYHSPCSVCKDCDSDSLADFVKTQVFLINIQTEIYKGQKNA